jgi:sulfatase modifying factor 1
MSVKSSAPASVFEKVLRAFDTGGFTYADFRVQLRRLLATGASPTELLDILRRRELIEPLPEYAHAQVLGLLNDAIEQAEHAVPAEAPDSDQDAADEVTIDLDDLDNGGEEPIPPGEDARRYSAGARRSSAASTASVVSDFVFPSKADAASLAGSARAMQERIARQHDDYQALSLSYERIREAEAAATARAAALAAELAAARAALESEKAKTREIDQPLAQSIASSGAARAKTGAQLQADLQEALARATALAAELTAARTALESEKNKTREIDKALAESIASSGAARSRNEEAQRQTERHQKELSASRDSLAARDAALAQARRSLSERDAQLAALQQEHAKTVPALDARAKAGARLEADLLAARARADALTAELKASGQAAAALSAQLTRGESRLDAARTELAAVKTQSNSHLELLRTREWRRGLDQNFIRELDAQVDAAHEGRDALQRERDLLQSQVASLQSKLAEQTAKIAQLQAQQGARAQRVEDAAAQRPKPAESPKMVESLKIVESPKAAESPKTVEWPKTAESLKAAVAVGDVLMDRYWLVALIGEGRASRVYKATDSESPPPRSPDSFVTIKVATRRMKENWSFSSFRDEVQKLAALAHPNIVRIVDCGRDGSAVFIAMEYLAGQSLYAKIHGGAAPAMPRSGLDRGAACTLILAIADALDYAHRNGVVHGNLQPGNVIVTNRGDVKVVDFHVAAWAGPETAPEHYASPQLMARGQPEPADDVYALACLAYELLTGTKPFDAGAGTQSLKSPPRRRAPLSSPQYAALVHALQHDSNDRTPSITQFVAEFSAPERGAARKLRANARAIMASAAVLVLAAVGWVFAHRAPVAAPLPAKPVAAAPQPGTVIRDCPTCPGMTVLPAGTFNQGSAGDESGTASFETPLHSVAIARSLAMSTNTVTVDEFQQFIAATGWDMQGCDTYDGEWKYRPQNNWTNPGFTQTGMHPVTCASWKDAEAYAQWLSTKTGHRYRLPSASEWEYAARAGGEAVQPWGADASGACANANVADASATRRYPGWAAFACEDGYVYTAPVGSFKINAFGLNDMLGNVFQWTEDCWHADYSGAPTDGSARRDGDCSEHELRGGSWFSTPAFVRANYRNHFAADYRTSSVGIRLVRDIEQ